MKKTQPVVAIILVSLLYSGCAPVNPKVSAAATAAGATSAIAKKAGGAAADPKALYYSDSQMFVLQCKHGDNLDANGGVIDNKPMIGKNEFILRFIHESDLSPVSADAHVTLEYTHLKAKIPQTYHGTVERQPDGSFLATVYFKKKGTWNLSFHFNDAKETSESNLMDNYAVPITF